MVTLDPAVNRQMPVKTLSSRKFVCWREIKTLTQTLRMNVPLRLLTANTHTTDGLIAVRVSHGYTDHHQGRGHP